MNLVLSAVGKKGLQNQWLHGDYDVVLFHYEEQGDSYRQGRITHIFKQGFKLELAKKYIEKNGIDNYDYYIFIDDDILTDNTKLEGMFNLAEQLKFKLFHPAMADVNMLPPYIHRAEKDVLCKNVAMHDLMCLGVSKDTLKTILPTFDKSKSCWGLPPLWSKMFEHDKMLFTLIDSIEMIHTRPHQEGGIYTTLGGVNKAHEENIEIVEKYNIKPKEWDIYERIYNKPILSITTIVADSDVNLLNQYFETLPSWAEKVIVRTVPKEIEIPFIDNIEKSDNSIFIDYFYPEGKFSFSDAMNVCLEYSTGMYVLKLDSDERLLIHQHNGLLEMLEKNIRTNVEGFYMWTISCIGGEHQKCETIKQARILKKNTWLKWSGGAHEYIETPKDMTNYILNTDLKIDHIGYDISNEEMKKKLIRNIRGMLNNPETILNKEQHFNLLVRDCSFLKTINDYLEKIEGNNNGS